MVQQRGLHGYTDSAERNGSAVLVDSDWKWPHAVEVVELQGEEVLRRLVLVQVLPG